MSRSRTHRSQWILLVAGPILSLIAFVAAFYLDPLNFEDYAPLAAIPAFLLSIVVLLISHNLAAFRELERTSRDSDRIYEAVKDYLHVTKVGSPETALEYVLARMPILQDVRNTSLSIMDEVERADERFYDTDTYLRMAPHIARCCSQRLRWKEIGDAADAATRMRRIAALVPSALGSDSKGQYQYKLITNSEPQINFILLTYGDGTAEVLFNWDFRNIGQDPVVLLSRDRDIVEMFSVQFEFLWRSASVDQDSIAVRSTSKK
jgi:hypothetical protein